MTELMDAVEDDETLRPMYNDLFALYMDRLAEVLRPYALDLAVSLIALEDSLTPTDPKE